MAERAPGKHGLECGEIVAETGRSARRLHGIHKTQSFSLNAIKATSGVE